MWPVFQTQNQLMGQMLMQPQYGQQQPVGSPSAAPMPQSYRIPYTAPTFQGYPSWAQDSGDSNDLAKLLKGMQTPAFGLGGAMPGGGMGAITGGGG